MWFWTIKTRARLNPERMPKIVKPFVTRNLVTLIGRRTGKHGDVFSVMLGAYEKHTDGARVNKARLTSSGAKKTLSKTSCGAE